jgi:hypothetical protein
MFGAKCEELIEIDPDLAFITGQRFRIDHFDLNLPLKFQIWRKL